ncbi:MAG: phosphatidylserine decarboxylase family protein [Desulfovibrio sp.]|nr:phosphatidylserine decarboxylase family protein [Desulfovibrio sp.]
MMPASLALAPEGIPIILLAALASLVFAFLKFPILSVLCLLFCTFSIYFFRDPERVIPDGEGIAVSPADGRILHIQKRMDPFLGEERICISIFMNLFNVHVNRVPVACTVSGLRYFPGTFVNASLDKASENNERCAWQLTDEQGDVWSMVQIAGLVARRIVCRAEKGDTLARGMRCGVIRFGSRVDLYLPPRYDPKISVGDHVIAGQSVIAELRKGN